MVWGFHDELSNIYWQIKGFNLDEIDIDEEVDFISKRTGYSEKLIEIILWQKCCYEMENDYWEYEGKCIKCGNSKLYIKEVHNVDFSDQVICKECETEFIR
ncbi:hypothetical protein [Clostridium tagluense]|uniref:hypothetical protein n=2 Tax=Clostridium TaxID=1485 RepID=UPI001C6E2DB5|nr:hypothetical protein [Clostridium tagluense]MBW9158743.1 hypothetical protein [Clostridium tagluense]WLC67386.1 hypothetical protein KTC93_09505 [Clostridium tagluense]